MNAVHKRPVPAADAAGRAHAAIACARDEEQEAARWARTERATEGPGWRVLDRPRAPHEELERLARSAWDLAFNGTLWPGGWTVKWGSLADALGLCVYGERMILIDERRFQKRNGQALLRTVLHELTHVAHLERYLTKREEMHGARFTETLKRVVAHVLGEPDGEQAMRVESAAQADGWEYAMAKHPDGRPVERPEARASFERFRGALRAAGGRAPTGPNGLPMCWRSDGTWVERTPEQIESLRQAVLEAETREGERARRASPSRGGGSQPLSVAEAVRRLQATFEAERAKDAAIAKMSRGLHTRRDAQRREERAVTERREQEAIRRYAAASADAVAWMQRYVLGWAGSPHPTVSECEGKLLALAFPNGPSLRAKSARLDRMAR